MLISQYIEALKNLVKDSKIDDTKTCDTVKIGETERNISKVAVSMFATPDVIRKAGE